MKARDFCFWLQGFFELTGGQIALTYEQTAVIKRHLDMVFKHDITKAVDAAENEGWPTEGPPSHPDYTTPYCGKDTILIC